MHVGFDGNDIESNKEISSVEPFAAAPRNIHNLIKYIYYNIRENVFSSSSSTLARPCSVHRPVLLSYVCNCCFFLSFFKCF